MKNNLTLIIQHHGTYKQQMGLLNYIFIDFPSSSYFSLCDLYINIQLEILYLITIQLIFVQTFDHQQRKTKIKI